MIKPPCDRCGHVHIPMLDARRVGRFSKYWRNNGYRSRDGLIYPTRKEAMQATCDMRWIFNV